MNCEIYVATIVKSRETEDDRLTVKILPQMRGIPDELCPRWPYFFKGQVFAGSVGELVWVICNSDFSLGYVLGPANYNTYPEQKYLKEKDFETGEEVNLSIPYDDLIYKIEKASGELIGQQISLQNVEVVFWNERSIHFIERSTGGFIIAYSTGSLLIMRPDAFVASINGKNTIKLDSLGFSVSGEAIKLESEEVGLGKSPSGSVMITNGYKSDAALTSKYVKA